jgi:PPP family 3-phenylpropionic acid transporter
MLVLLGVALLMGSSAMLLGFGAIQWSAQGISNGNIGLLYSVAAGSEILVFAFAQTLLGKRSELVLLVVGAAVTIVRWLGMATDPSLKYLVALALLQGPAATALIVGNILYIARRFPTHLVATANGVNAVLVGVCAAAVTFVAGYLWEALQARAYLPMAAIATVALVIFLVSARRQTRCNDAQTSPVFRERLDDVSATP